jgi:hypothetical protein
MPIINYPIRLNAVSMFLERAFKVKDEYIYLLNKEYTPEEWNDFGEAEHDRAFDVLLDYHEIVTRAVLWELNALVENELKWAAKSICRKQQGMVLGAKKNLTRQKAIKVIESEFGIRVEDLPGFNEVDEIRKISNAYKHDDGYSGEYEPFFIGFITKKYELDPDIANRYLSAVSEFLGALPGERLKLGENISVKLYK